MHPLNSIKGAITAGVVPATDDEKAAARKIAARASRINFILSLPMLMCMGGQSHGLPL